MIAVIFEICLVHEEKQEYLNRAAALRPILEKCNGFISIERFESLYEPGKILSLSFWRDEESIARWRQEENHRSAQSAGRSGIFKEYHIRVARVIRDYGLIDRSGAPKDSQEYHRALV
jgi:heme-degrading monooxygenase HmoA